MKLGTRLLPSMAGRNGIDPRDHDRLVIQWAMKSGARRPVRDSEQYANGWIGLLYAADRYDPSRGTAFSTYAVPWIRQFMYRPYQMLRAAKYGGGKIKTLIASELGDADSRRPIGRDLAVDRDPLPVEAAIEADELGAAEKLAADLLRHLDPRTERIVRRHVMLDWTLEDIGAGESPPITRERVRQLVVRGLRQMQVVAERRGLRWSIATMEIMER